MIKILYEDNHIIVVEKPENVPVQSDSSHDADLLNMIKEYLRIKYNKPGNVYLGLVHRLDRPVGGLMVFAKTSKAASRLFTQIANKDFIKSYYAVVENSFDDLEGKYVDYINKTDEGTSYIDENGKEAILEYKVLEIKNDRCLLEINLITGRHHQIRTQMAYHNHPLCGDQRYNKQDNTPIALYAYKLSFLHPITNERLTFISKPKKYGYWKSFSFNVNDNVKF